MRRVAVAVLIVAVVLAAIVPSAQACGECVALGVVSFLAFAGIVAAATAPPVVYAAPAYYAAPWSYPGAYAPAGAYPPAYYYGGYSPPRYYYPAAYPSAYVAAPPAVWTGPRVVQYAHGRYELRGDGVRAPWAWVWIPNGPPAPPVPANLDGPEGSGAARER